MHLPVNSVAVISMRKGQKKRRNFGELDKIINRYLLKDKKNSGLVKIHYAL